MSFSTKSLLLTSAVCSDWPTGTMHCDWPNTTSTSRKCTIHNRKLKLSNKILRQLIMSLVFFYHQFKPERGTELRDRHSDDARMCLHTRRGYVTVSPLSLSLSLSHTHTTLRCDPLSLPHMRAHTHDRNVCVKQSIANN